MAAPAMAQEKEVFMDVTSAPQSGGGGRTRRRRGRRTQRQEGGGVPDAPVPTVAVEKDGGVPVPASVGKEVAPIQQTGGAAKSPKVIIAPAKKKPAKVMLIPKSAGQQRVAAIKKTFKAKRVHVTIDNTSKTIKRRRQVLGKVDAMTDEQVREAAESARLSRRGAKAPTTLLRQMLKDYQTMKGMLL